MYIGNLVIGGSFYSFVIQNVGDKYATLIPHNSVKSYEILKKYENTILPFIIGVDTKGFLFYFYNCIIKSISSFNLDAGAYLCFDKVLCLTSNCNLDIENIMQLKVKNVIIKGKNIKSFIGVAIKDDIKSEKIALSMKDRSLDIEISLKTYRTEISKIKEDSSIEIEPILMLNILNSTNIKDYFELLQRIEFVLSFCCVTDNNIYDKIDFSVVSNECKDYVVDFTVIEKESTVVVKPFESITLSDITLKEFAILLTEINKRIENNILHRDFLSHVKCRNMDDFNNSFVSIVRTFENEFDLFMPKYKVNNDVLNYMIELLENGYNEEKLPNIKKKDYKKLVDSYISFMQLRTARLDEKIYYMFENYFNIIPDNLSEEIKDKILNVKTCRKLCKNFVDNRNNISHGKEYNVSYSKEDLIIFYCLIIFIYYFYLRVLNLNEKDMKKKLSFILQGRITDGFIKIDEDEWKKRYKDNLDTLIETFIK